MQSIPNFHVIIVELTLDRWQSLEKCFPGTKKNTVFGIILTIYVPERFHICRHKYDVFSSMQDAGVYIPTKPIYMVPLWECMVECNPVHSVFLPLQDSHLLFKQKHLNCTFYEGSFELTLNFTAKGMGK